MRVTILCSSFEHPINGPLEGWITRQSVHHEIALVRRKADLPGGDLLFLISCAEIVAQEDRNAYRKALVIHASDLPRGRGWSPHVWQIIEGATDIPVTLLEAADKVDSGDIWHQVTCRIPKDALWDEINRQIFDAELALMDFAVGKFDDVSPRPQASGVSPTYYPKRTPKDSELDAGKTIAEQFDLIRVCDPDRFPAHFKLNGHKYKIRVEKMDE